MQKSLDELKDITKRLEPLLAGMREFCKELGDDDIVSLSISDTLVNCMALANNGQIIDVIFWADGKVTRKLRGEDGGIIERTVS